MRIALPQSPAPMCFLVEKNARDVSRGLPLNMMGFLPSSEKVLPAFRWNDELSLPPPPFAREFPIHSLAAFNLPGVYVPPLLLAMDILIRAESFQDACHRSGEYFTETLSNLIWLIKLNTRQTGDRYF